MSTLIDLTDRENGDTILVNPSHICMTNSDPLDVEEGIDEILRRT